MVSTLELEPGRNESQNYHALWLDSFGGSVAPVCFVNVRLMVRSLRARVVQLNFT